LTFETRAAGSINRGVDDDYQNEHQNVGHDCVLCVVKTKGVTTTTGDPATGRGDIRGADLSARILVVKLGMILN
jgi:hypothetical protein